MEKTDQSGKEMHNHYKEKDMLSLELEGIDDNACVTEVGDGVNLIVEAVHNVSAGLQNGLDERVNN